MQSKTFMSKKATYIIPLFYSYKKIIDIKNKSIFIKEAITMSNELIFFVVSN